jgi:hypothetical protein
MWCHQLSQINNSLYSAKRNNLIIYTNDMFIESGV